MNEFETNNLAILELLDEWAPKLSALPDNVITNRKNRQNRTIKQILGHLNDSASNNTHRIIHLQYQASPLIFPCYAHHGNNDRWIAIQDYQTENWEDLIQLWKYTNIHLIHVIRHVDSNKLEHEWINGLGERISLKSMILSYFEHLKLHLGEINELIDAK